MKSARIEFCRHGAALALRGVLEMSCLGFSGACSSSYQPLPRVASSAPLRAEAADNAASPVCELWLHAEQRHQSSNLVTSEIPQSNLGVHFVHEGANGVFESGVCLKYANAPLAIPGPIRVSTKAFAWGDEERFCRDTPKAAKETLLGTVAALETEVCEWSGQFHAARPFTFTLQGYGTAAVADSSALSRFMQLIQVWRNGELVYRWAPKPTGETMLVIPGKVLTVRSSIIAASLPPHLADFDLRIFPAGIDVDARVLSLKAMSEEEARARRWESVSGLALDSILAQVDPELKKSISCYVHQLRVLGAKYGAVVAKQDIPEDHDCQVIAPELTVPATSLIDTYASLEGAAATELDDAETRILHVLQERAKLLGSLVSKARDALVAEIKKRGEGSPHKELVSKVDALAKDALQVVDDTARLVRALRGEGVRLAADPESKLAAYNQFVPQLASSNTIFEARKDNPLPIEGERSLSMEYSDRFQAFMLAPWFGVPFRLVGSTVGADLNETVAIPILDLIGLRWQMGKSRFGDIRLGLIGIAAFKEPLPVSTELGVPIGDQTEDTFGVAPEMSLGFGTFQAAAGYVVTKHDYYHEHRERRFRLFFGADLIKLLFGKNGDLL